ncbi:uncharacterized protein LOC34620097 [Cyclospora cayetanensis]|uniref:Uncharacterized protein LOC34620097 n=1 Tax=Cyclospora cayetanensis TaxID=88456 RepID=A0A6P6S572_9EIME|nr:uncharacterized protein LOC34620097 [Cyclospora cayetanensis]
MEGLGAKEMEALAELLCPDTADSGDLDGASPIPRPQASSGKYRSNAKPNVKVKAKIGRKEELDIWKLDELNQGATFRQLKDHRTEPEHETLEDRVVVDSPLHKLNLALPYSVNPDEGTAKWMASTCTLLLRLPIRRKIEYVQI